MAGIDERWNGMNYIEEINKMLKGASEKELQRAYYFLRGFMSESCERKNRKEKEGCRVETQKRD